MGAAARLAAALKPAAGTRCRGLPARLVRVGLIAVLAGPALSAAEAGLVTSVSGSVTREARGELAAVAVLPFSRLNEGDRVTLEGTSHLQLVFFSGGGQETWRGAGTLEVGAGSGRRIKGTALAELRPLPAGMVRQMAKTPSPDGTPPSIAARTRSMPAGGTLETIEKNYAELRRQADAADRNPEIYLLASYFELREFARLESLIGQMDEGLAADPEVKVLKSLYVRAIRNAKTAAVKSLPE